MSVSEKLTSQQKQGKASNCFVMAYWRHLFMCKRGFWQGEHYCEGISYNQCICRLDYLLSVFPREKQSCIGRVCHARCVFWLELFGKPPPLSRWCLPGGEFSWKPGLNTLNTHFPISTTTLCKREPCSSTGNWTTSLFWQTVHAFCLLQPISQIHAAVDLQQKNSGY